MEEGRNWRMMSPVPEEDFKSEDMAVDSRFSAFRLDKDIAATARHPAPPRRHQTGGRSRGYGTKARSQSSTSVLLPNTSYHVLPFVLMVAHDTLPITRHRNKFNGARYPSKTIPPTPLSPSMD